MEAYFGVIVFIFGLIIGSFLNCLIWRLYKEESIMGRSYCPSCSQMIAWFDNIPLFSFLNLRGRCRRCRGDISWQYPAVELVTAILFLSLWHLHAEALAIGSQGAWLLARDLIVITFLIVIFVYDARWQLVPVNLVWLVGALIFALQLYLGVPVITLLFYGAVGGLFFLIQYLVTRRRGVGEGDIWLGIFLGICFPAWPSLFLIMLATYSLGAMVGLGLLTWGQKKWKTAIALGPFLAIAAVIALFFGDKIINWYLGLLF